MVLLNPGVQENHEATSVHLGFLAASMLASLVGFAAIVALLRHATSLGWCLWLRGQAVGLDLVSHTNWQKPAPYST
jgi:hypothetical protein